MPSCDTHFEVNELSGLCEQAPNGRRELGSRRGTGGMLRVFASAGVMLSATFAVGCFGAEGYGSVDELTFDLGEDDETGASNPSTPAVGPGGTPVDDSEPTPGLPTTPGLEPSPTNPGEGPGNEPVDPGNPAEPGEGPVASGGAGNEPVDGAGGAEPVEPAGPAFMCEDIDIDCVDGKAGEFDCSGVDLLAHLDGPAMQGGTGNDIWGWEDPDTGKEYVLMGLTNGTAFVDISDPCRPVHLGHLRTETVNEIWRDIKVYQNHAYIVAESRDHGIQVFDLTQLRNVTNPPVVFEANNVINDIGATHNIVMNENTGFAYTVLANNCSSARSFNLADPMNPVDAGCWGVPARIHDAQCVTYNGPDAAFVGRELCFSGNERAGVAVYDVTDKANVAILAETRYPNVSYGHQGWLTEDHRYFLFGDEADEISAGVNTTLYAFDVTNLSAPTLSTSFVGDLPATDHNVYVRGNYAFLASYAAGVRILDLSAIDDGIITEAGYFDTFPRHNNPGFNDMWSNYPYFRSGVLVTSGGEGLFILHPNAEFMQ